MGIGEIDAYYKDKIESAASDLLFIKRIKSEYGIKLGGGHSLSVCEIGCGNRKLLCNLKKTI